VVDRNRPLLSASWIINRPILSASWIVNRPLLSASWIINRAISHDGKKGVALGE